MEVYQGALEFAITMFKFVAPVGMIMYLLERGLQFAIEFAFGKRRVDI